MKKDKNIKLDNEEKKLLKSIEKGEWHSVKNVKAKKAQIEKMAKDFLRKDARINIRISMGDLDRIKRIAAYEGLPYQTLIASLLHKYAAGHLCE